MVEPFAAAADVDPSFMEAYTAVVGLNEHFSAPTDPAWDSASLEAAFNLVSQACVDAGAQPS